MTNMFIDPKALDAVKNFHLPEVQGFGRILAPIMIEALYEKGEWKGMKLLPYGPISLDPSSKVLHYGQEIFEGMKAYKVATTYPILFRPDQNFRRFNLSAQRLGMPTIPENYFFESIETIVSYCAPFIPSQSGQSLYVRPFMFACESQLGVQPSNVYRYMVLASPTASYFSGQVNVLIERKNCRAAPGGTGAAKAGGNYAASASSALKAQALGYQQVLWLDAIHKKYIEELSAMNFFAVINETLHTPALTNSILPGVTRDSILQLLPQLGLKAIEEKMDIDELCQLIRKGECTEAFACGTASIVSPIHSLGDENGEKYPLPLSSGPITQKVRQTILDIQEGRQPGPAGWVRPVLPLPF